YLFRKIKEKYGDFDIRVIKELIQKINSIFIILYGIYIILSVILLDNFYNIGEVKVKLSTLEIVLLTIYLLLGYLFLIVGRLSIDKQKKSLKLIMITGFSQTIFLIAIGENIVSILPVLILMALGFYTRGLLFKERFIYSWEEKTVDFMLILVGFFFYILNINRNKYHSLTLSLGYIILILALFILIAKAIFSYMKKGGDNLYNTNLDDLDTLIDKYGSSQSLASGLSFLNDKYIYYYIDKEGEKTVAFQYQIINNKAIVMGEPFGKEADIPLALFCFNEVCQRSGLNPIFYEVGEQFTLSLHDYGYDFMKFGENAIVSLSDFSLKGRKKSTERNILNRFAKEGYKFQIVSFPYTDEFLDKLEDISNSWLRDRKEKGFSLGFFDRDYLRKSDIAIVMDKDEEITAFTNIMPNKNPDVLTIDLMRYDQDKNVNSMMDFLFLNLFIYGKENSYKYFNLGMAPLSNVGLMKSAYLSERLAYLVYTHGSRFYSFKGLRNYKQKYASIWLPKYMAYAKGNWLLYSLLAVSLIDNKLTKNNK
ncbi:phosphatidylglycerol lysyltransferase domain-containing protein, partial [Anaerococcus sp.]|uniref:phosphatidylglycerol lysyltransferase domain-containing protein n=1 Tax=Anaerococcus sp. TaxID=1872515 RepID=UPI0027BA6160